MRSTLTGNEPMDLDDDDDDDKKTDLYDYE